MKSRVAREFRAAVWSEFERRQSSPQRSDVMAVAVALANLSDARGVVRSTLGIISEDAFAPAGRGDVDAMTVLRFLLMRREEVTQAVFAVGALSALGLVALDEPLSESAEEMVTIRLRARRVAGG